jgi:hypothetical protein
MFLTKAENPWPLFRICMTGLAVRGSCWLLLAGIFAFAWAAPLLTPWQENPQILQPARAQAAWIYAWLALATWLPFQAATLGRRLRTDGLLEFQRARGLSPLTLCLQVSASILVWVFAIMVCASVVCLSMCMPKLADEAWLWFCLVMQYAVLYTLVAAPLVLLGVALGTCAGEVIAFLVPAFLLFTGLIAASWLEPVLTGSSSALHRLGWLALPHYHLADLTPRLVFKMGPLTQGDFLGSVTCLGLQGLAITLTSLCIFRTRS